MGTAGLIATSYDDVTMMILGQPKIVSYPKRMAAMLICDIVCSAISQCWSCSVQFFRSPRAPARTLKFSWDGRTGSAMAYGNPIAAKKPARSLVARSKKPSYRRRPVRVLRLKTREMIFSGLRSPTWICASMASWSKF